MGSLITRRLLAFRFPPFRLPALRAPPLEANPLGAVEAEQGLEFGATMAWPPIVDDELPVIELPVIGLPVIELATAGLSKSIIWVIGQISCAKETNQVTPER